MSADPTRPAVDADALLERYHRLLERLTPDRAPPWYTVEAPWRRDDHPTYAIAGQRDPHGAPAVLDTMAVEHLIELEDEDLGGRDSVDVADAALELAVLAVNVLEPLAQALVEAHGRAESIRRELEDTQLERDARGAILDMIQAEAGANWWHGAIEVIRELRVELSKPIVVGPLIVGADLEDDG